LKSDSSFLENNEILLPNRCHEGHQGLKNPVFTGFFRPLNLFPLGKISVSIAICIEIWHKTFANMLMPLAYISSIWLSQYQNSIIDYGEIQPKTSYFSSLIFAFFSNIRGRLDSQQYILHRASLLNRSDRKHSFELLGNSEQLRFLLTLHHYKYFGFYSASLDAYYPNFIAYFHIQGFNHLHNWL